LPKRTSPDTTDACRSLEVESRRLEELKCDRFAAIANARFVGQLKDFVVLLQQTPSLLDDKTQTAIEDKCLSFAQEQSKSSWKSFGVLDCLTRYSAKAEQILAILAKDEDYKTKCESKRTQLKAKDQNKSAFTFSLFQSAPTASNIMSPLKIAPTA
jgi:hypothetical protein